MSIRFDFEQELLQFANILNDIDAVTTFMIDESNCTGDDVDRVSNMLIGIKDLYDVKFDHLFKSFEKLLKDAYCG